MTPDAVLIQQPAIDFTTFLGLSHSALGYSPASSADASQRNFTDAERFLSCLASLRDQKATAGLTPNLLSHVSFSVFIAAEDRDLIDILEAASGMPFVRSETIKRGIDVAVVTGNLAQWRDAVRTGCTAKSESNVRICYSKILSLFDRAGLSAVWNEFNRRATTDHSGLYLEDKRK